MLIFFFVFLVERNGEGVWQNGGEEKNTKEVKEGNKAGTKCRYGRNHFPQNVNGIFQLVKFDEVCTTDLCQLTSVTDRTVNSEAKP
jgi:hypothetical protein